MFTFKWLGQGGFELTLGDKRVIIDPYLSDSVIKLDGFARLLPLPVKPEELSFAVGRLEGEITERKIYESALRRELFSLKAERLGSGERVCVFESGLSPDEIRRYCLTLGEKFAVAAVFSGKDGEWKYAISSKTKNCADFAKAINAAFAGRGGGKPELVQGSCGGKREEIELFFSSL